MSVSRILFKLSRRSHFFCRVFCKLYNCDIPMSVTFKGKLNLLHGYTGIVIHPDAVIGDNVTMNHNVLIGQRNGKCNVVIEDNAVINAYSIICGDVTIGKNAIIGVGSLVMHDVPANHIFFNKREDVCYSRELSETHYNKEE